MTGKGTEKDEKYITTKLPGHLYKFIKERAIAGRRAKTQELIVAIEELYQIHKVVSIEELHRVYKRNPQKKEDGSGK